MAFGKRVEIAIKETLIFPAGKQMKLVLNKDLTQFNAYLDMVLDETLPNVEFFEAPALRKNFVFADFDYSENKPTFLFTNKGSQPYAAKPEELLVLGVSTH